MRIQRVLIIKHGSIGDIFLSFDSVKAIQKKYSDVTLLSTNTGHKIFDDSDFNFKKIIDNRQGFFNTFKILFRIISQKFDIVIDLQNSKRTSFYLLILKLLSNSISNGTSFFASKRYQKINLNEHVKEGLKNQLSILDIQVDGVVDKHQRNIKQQVIIVPGSSKEGFYKRWDISNFNSLMKYLSSKNISSYVIGGVDETDLSKLIPENEFIHNLINKSPWKVVKSTALESIVAISNDTSTMHYISSLNVPIIALMKKNSYSVRNAPTSKNSIVIAKKNINDISVEEVKSALSRFI
jgi:ADP-heptose:LPS heptosyltransferase